MSLSRGERIALGRVPGAYSSGGQRKTAHEGGGAVLNIPVNLLISNTVPSFAPAVTPFEKLKTFPDTFSHTILRKTRVLVLLAILRRRLPFRSVTTRRKIFRTFLAHEFARRLQARLRAAAIALTVLIGAPAASAEIESDDVVLFFPTSGHQPADRREWVLPVHGWIYQPEADSTARAVALDALRRLLELEPTSDEMPLFKQRAWPFLVDNERGREISVQLGNRYFFLEKSQPNGHFQGELHLPVAEAEALLSKREAGGRWLLYSALTGEGDDRLLAGKVQLLDDRGVSVISDIDDTIRLSNVRDRRALLEGTFLRRFEAVPGMARTYRRWAAEGAAFHYVTAGPWQLFAPLEQFRIAEDFPAGSFDMQLFRWKDRTALNLASPPDELKRPAIEALLAKYPGRQFICVGDSGQSDPELYAGLARRYPRQIVRILIRNTSGEPADGARFRAAFADLPRESWRVFEHARELDEIKLAPDARQ